MQLLKPANFQGRLERVRLLRDYQGDALKAGRLLAGVEIELSHGDVEYLVVNGYGERLDSAPSLTVKEVAVVSREAAVTVPAAAEDEALEVVPEAVEVGDVEAEPVDEPVVVKPAPRKRAKKSEAADEAS